VRPSGIYTQNYILIIIIQKLISILIEAENDVFNENTQYALGGKFPLL
jgi:hypothetical protein